jgi:spoIIIJ-associated protein
MEKLEIVASNLDEAKSRAAEQLGVSVDQVEVEVIDETKGLFGKPGKVTVHAWSTVKPEPVAVLAPAPVVEPEVEPVAVVEEKPKRRSRKAEVEAAPVEAAAEPMEVEEESAPQAEDVATNDDADHILGVVKKLLDAGDMRAEATLSQLNGRYIHIDIDGPDVGFLIGRRGEVLNSIQYILNVISARHLNNGVRVVVEGDNYRERRAEMLTNMARQIAEQVVERGEEAVLDALPAFERRVIHQALVDIEGINTYSEGEEPNRCVVIAPAG